GRVLCWPLLLPRLPRELLLNRLRHEGHERDVVGHASRAGGDDEAPSGCGSPFGVCREAAQSSYWFLVGIQRESTLRTCLPAPKQGCSTRRPGEEAVTAPRTAAQ